MTATREPAPQVRNPDRRRLLQLGALGASAVPLSAATGVLANPERPAPQPYSGPGYYLYPAWGDPVLYHVSAVQDTRFGTHSLAFRDPVGGRLLWVQSIAGEATFAGRLLP